MEKPIANKEQSQRPDIGWTRERWIGTISGGVAGPLTALIGYIIPYGSLTDAISDMHIGHIIFLVIIPIFVGCFIGGYVGRKLTRGRTIGIILFGALASLAATVITFILGFILFYVFFCLILSMIMGVGLCW